MKKFLVALLTITTLLTLVATGCSKAASTTSSAPVSQASSKTLYIGIGTVLTGPAANLGLTYQRAVEMAMADQNAKGGVVIGGQRYTLSDVVRDTKFDPTTAKSVAQEEVLDDHVIAIFGPSQNEVPAMQQITNDNKVFLFGMSAMDNQTGPNYPYNFFLGGIADEMDYSVLSYTHKNYPQAKNVVSFYLDMPDNPLWAASAQEVSKHFGLNWLGMVKFPITTTDFSPFAQQLMSYNPDIIDLEGSGGGAGGECGTIITQLRQAGFNGVIALSTAPPPGILNTVPKQYLNKVVTDQVNPDSSVVASAYKDLITRYQKENGSLPIDMLQSCYNGAEGFFSFLNGQKDMDPQRLMNAFTSYTWQGVYGQQSSWIGESMFGINRCERTTYWVSEYKDGQLVTYNNDVPNDMTKW